MGICDTGMCLAQAMPWQRPDQAKQAAEKPGVSQEAIAIIGLIVTVIGLGLAIITLGYMVGGKSEEQP